MEIAIGLHEKLKLAGPDKKERPVRIFRCTAAKANKRARETAAPAAGKGGKGGKGGGKGGGEGGKGKGKGEAKPSSGTGGSGFKGGYMERQRQRQVKETHKELKPKMSAAAKIKKERKEKVRP